MTRWQGWIMSFSAALLAVVLAGPPLYSQVASSIQWRIGDSAAVGNLGTAGLTVRKDTPVAMAAANQYQPPITDSSGRTWTASNLAQVGGTAVGITNPIPVRFTDGTAFVAPSTVDADDGTVAAAQQNVGMAIDLAYCFGGTAWTRCGTNALSRTISAATTNATNVKPAAGVLHGIFASNVNAAPRFVHLYNTAGVPACTASIIATFIIPPSNSGTNIVLGDGVWFGSGIGFCITADNAALNAVTASDVVLTLEYK
jgi:hypothetical protein